MASTETNGACTRAARIASRASLVSRSRRLPPSRRALASLLGGCRVRSNESTIVASPGSRVRCPRFSRPDARDPDDRNGQQNARPAAPFERAATGRGGGFANGHSRGNIAPVNVSPGKLMDVHTRGDFLVLYLWFSQIEFEYYVPETIRATFLLAMDPRFRSVLH